jgi:hypothetical protein
MAGGARSWWLGAAAVVVVVGLAWAVVFALAQPAGRAPAPSGATPGQSGETPAFTPAGPVAYVEGRVTAGPVCPVVRSPEPSECAPRPVAGAVIVASLPGQGEAARATTDADGRYLLKIDGIGVVTLTAQPVEGLMRAPEPAMAVLVTGMTIRVDFQYDTGIR